MRAILVFTAMFPLLAWSALAGAAPSARMPVVLRFAGRYKMIAAYASGFGAQTGMFVREWGELFVAARRQRTGQTAGILEYHTQ